MSVFIPNLILINLMLRLLFLSGIECFEKERTDHLARWWREQALAAPRCSYQKIHCYEKAIALDPAYAEAYLELGELYYDLAISYGHRDLCHQAIQTFSKTLELSPSSLEAHYRLGTLYFLLGDFQRCRQELEKARQIEPGYQPVKNSLRLLEQIRSRLE